MPLRTVSLLSIIPPAQFRTALSASTRRLLLVFFVLMVLPGFLGIAQAQPLPIVVSIVPQQYFVERLGGEHVAVSVMVPPGASPATYEPKPSQMAALANARLYLAIDVPFEKAWLPRIASANPSMRVAHTDKGIEKLPMAAHHHHDGDEEHNEHAHDSATTGHDAEHDEHAEHGHEHGGVDPHIWLGPAQARHMVESMLQELVRADPDHADVFRANYAALDNELTALDNEINAIFSPIPEEKRVFMVFHPSWGYFAKNYKLEQIPIEYEGKEPTPRILAELMSKAREHGIRTIFIQPQFPRRSAEAIARQIDGTVVTADPLAYDWFDNLRTVAQSLAASFTR